MNHFATQNLVALLEQHAATQPHKLACEFPKDRKNSVKITHGELAQRAGAFAVFAYPPTFTKTIGRLLSIVEDADTRIVLTTSDILLRIRLGSIKVKGFRGLNWVSTNNVKDKHPSRWLGSEVTRENVAILQYTSGSTSTSSKESTADREGWEP